jgi:hypothetical protein
MRARGQFLTALASLAIVSTHTSYAPVQRKRSIRLTTAKRFPAAWPRPNAV